jgi:hypothetical protein
MPGQDLTRVTIPSFFLEPRSLLERLADTLTRLDGRQIVLEAAPERSWWRIFRGRPDR